MLNIFFLFLELWLSDFCRSNVLSIWEKYICNYCLGKCIPNRPLQSRWTAPWITRGIINLECKLKCIHKKNGVENNVSEIRSDLSRRISKARAWHFTNTLASFLKHDPVKFWHLTDSTKPVEQIMVSNSVIPDLTEICNHFNHFLQSIFAEADDYNYTAPSSTSINANSTT